MEYRSMGEYQFTQRRRERRAVTTGDLPRLTSAFSAPLREIICEQASLHSHTFSLS